MATKKAIILTSDFMFSSRVVSIGQSLDLEVDAVISTAALPEAVEASQAVLVIIDLSNIDSSVDQIVTPLRKLDPPPTTVAFGPHVDEAVLQAAQAAGCDIVLTRGQFHQQIGELLQEYLA